MASQQKCADVIVAGAGPAGMIAALALAGQNADVILAGPPASADDRRTTTLMAPSMAALIPGVADTLRRDGAPLKVMRILDGTTRLLRSPPVSFHAAELGVDAFGWNIPNRAINAALETAVADDSRISRISLPIDAWVLGPDSVEAQLAGGRTVIAKLACAADGRNSKARAAAGIAANSKKLGQSAFVATFAHQRPHLGISTEFHTETGPCTQVPLPGNRSSLVWVVRPETADKLAALDAAGLSMEIEMRLQSILGKVAVEAGWQVWPLETSLPAAFAQNRVALAGEAAHVFPPIGAQGLNLSVRDATDLAACFAAHRDDPGSDAAMQAYDRKRRPDILARISAVSALNATLLADFLPAQAARSAGLGALGALSPLRAFFMREGMSPGAGFAALSEGLRKKIGSKSA